ncbi:hypothetical protein K435DRAFT_68030 [Dendrothele bispora CBS 962.96]|uniref:Uncharacterized protein n=1 Tax=Dendrothele bispora (strain CBS 962.96) TaxID=1314807 RepID=A0A4S8KQR6_DENBC|nr:hypothetical protein K435DRAFT_68030 [Dendrothele bispora CBS 962.96]
MSLNLLCVPCHTGSSSSSSGNPSNRLIIPYNGFGNFFKFKICHDSSPQQQSSGSRNTTSIPQLLDVQCPSHSSKIISGSFTKKLFLNLDVSSRNTSPGI